MRKRKIAIVNFDAYGHVQPTVELTRALVKNGHTVDYLIPPSLSGLVEGTGARIFPYDATFSEASQEEIIGPEAVLAQSRKWLVQTGIHMLPSLLAYCEAEKPDILAFDRLCWPSVICARRFNIPSAMLHASYCGSKISPGLNSLFEITKESTGWTVLEKYLTALRNEYPEAPGSAEDVFADHDKCNIVFMSRHFHPSGERFDNRYHFTGAQVAPVTRRRRKEQKLVYLSLGTVFGYMRADFFRECIEVFAHSEWDLIVSTGRSHSLADFAPLPDNVKVFQHTDQLAVLSEASAFVTHGGMNSVQEAISLEVPMVVIPQAFDQLASAERVSKLGCGIAFRESDSDFANALRTAVAQVMASSDIPVNLSRERSYSDTAGGAFAAAELIQSLA